MASCSTIKPRRPQPPLSPSQPRAIPTTPASGTAEAPGGSSEPENPVPQASAPAAETTTPKTLVSSDLREAIRQCEGDRKECVREFVAGAAPETKYIGGRVDFNAGGSGRNKEIFYFEDPSLGTCENTRQEYATKDSITTILLRVHKPTRITFPRLAARWRTRSALRAGDSRLKEREELPTARSCGTSSGSWPACLKQLCL
jgi:hypothetical protein